MYDALDGRIRGRKGMAIRRRFLQRNPLCVKCDEKGLVVLAEEVDHIIPLSKDGADNELNKQGLCKACHVTKSAGESGSSIYGQFFPEWLEPSICDLTIVHGPPGSGKSRYVADHATPSDVVIDLDDIKAELSGNDMYSMGDEWLWPALRKRNHLLGRLSRETGKAWFIVTGQKPDRPWWERKLKPTEVIVISTGEATCIERIKADDRRPDYVKALHIKSVKKWWQAETGHRVKTTRKLIIGLDGYAVE